MLLPPQCCRPLNVAVSMLLTLNVPAPKMLAPSKYLRRLRWDKRFIAYQPLATSRELSPRASIRCPYFSSETYSLQRYIFRSIFSSEAYSIYLQRHFLFRHVFSSDTYSLQRYIFRDTFSLEKYLSHPVIFVLLGIKPRFKIV
jgi:hypothetical protein